MLYVFGNSHAAMFSNVKPCGTHVPYVGDKQVKIGVCPPNIDHPTMCTVFLGPVTAYNLYEHEQYLLRIPQYLEETQADPGVDAIGLNMGEIDCRVHMAKRALKGEDPKALAEECVTRYYQNIQRLIERWKVVVFGVHPTTLEGHDENPDAPHYGSCELRNNLCVEFNAALARRCEADGVPFVSIYDRLVDENNLTKMEYFVDYCHLSYEKCFPFYLEEMKRLSVYPE